MDNLRWEQRLDDCYQRGWLSPEDMDDLGTPRLCVIGEKHPDFPTNLTIDENRFYDALAMLAWGYAREASEYPMGDERARARIGRIQKVCEICDAYDTRHPIDALTKLRALPGCREYERWRNIASDHLTGTIERNC